MIDKMKYFLWAATNFIRLDTICPYCNSLNTYQVKRKYIVTFLYGCNTCKLRFRVPKDTINSNEKFYQTDYGETNGGSENLTTNIPDDGQLQEMLKNKFFGTSKDFRQYISILQAIGIKVGDIILDWGASWGYGSWQFTQAGYKVYSYEISKPRAEFSRKYLECSTINSMTDLPEKVDCFFSAHVIEHLPDPKIMWEQALQVLKPDGYIVVFTPNGDERLATSANYHQKWGKVHPLLITPTHLQRVTRDYNLIGRTYTHPYDLQVIHDFAEQDDTGDELLFIGKRNGIK